MLNVLASEFRKWLQPSQSPGKTLRALREKHGWTQQALAESIGCSDNIISRLERDEQAFKNVAEVVNFAKALGCTEVERTELVEAFLYSHAKISLWITSRLFMEYPENLTYQKAFKAALDSVLREEIFVQERKDRKNNQAKKHRLQPVLNKITIVLLTTTIALGTLITARRFSSQFAQITSPTLIPTLAATATPRLPTLLFVEDFETGDLSMWENRNSIGRIVQEGNNHILRLANSTDAFVIFLLSHRPWANYAVEADIRIEQSNPTNTDVFLNIRDNAHGSYSGSLDFETSMTGLLAGIDGNFYDLGTKTIALSTLRWMKLRIQAVEDSITLYVNDRLVQTASDRYHIAGTISFSVAPHTVVAIDNVRVIDAE